MSASLALGSWDARWPAIFRPPGIACFFTMSGPLRRNWLPQAASSANRARRLPKKPTSSSSWCRIRRMWKRFCSAPSGVAEGISKGKIVVDMSSISPLATKEFAKKINALGADYLDAPVSGGEVGAKAAIADDHGGRPGKGVQHHEAAVREDGQEHHPRRRERRRPDHQGRQPDHRRA